MLITTMEHIGMNPPKLNEARYTCKWCHRVFVNEVRYMDHVCKQMKREQEAKSPNGQAAWHYYQTWMRHMKRASPSITAFSTSRYFRTFINFVEFTKRVSLPNVDGFIWLMVHKEFPPSMWTTNAAYVLFIEHLDRQISGIDAALMSIQTLISYCDKNGIPDSSVFEHIPMQDVIHLLHVRKLSPWLLLMSKTFKKALGNATPEQQLIVQTLIRPEYWPEKMAEHPADVATIKKLVQEMGI